MSRLDAFEAAALAATSGPWDGLWVTADDKNFLASGSQVRALGREIPDGWGLFREPPSVRAVDEFSDAIGPASSFTLADATFIALANPETVLALVALVKELSAALTDFTSEWGFDACRATDDGTCRECSVSWPCPTERSRAALASAATWMEE